MRHEITDVHAEAETALSWDNEDWPASLPDLMIEVRVFEGSSDPEIPSDPGDPVATSEVAVDRSSADFAGPITFFVGHGDNLSLSVQLVDWPEEPGRFWFTLAPE